MNKLKTKIGLLLIAFLCAYTVDGISQSVKSSSKKEVVIIKKMIDDNGNETVEKQVFSGDELTDEELEKLIESETGSNADVNIWKSDDAEEIEISIDDADQMLIMEDERIEKFLKGKGLSMDDVAEMNVNVNSSTTDGNEIIRRTISVLDNNGKKHEFETVSNHIDTQGLTKSFMKVEHKPRLGIMIGQDPDGILVNDVLPDSPAQRAGLEKGDVIYALGETHVHTTQELLDALKTVGNKSMINYRRDGKVKVSTVEFTTFDYDGPTEKKIIIKKEDK